MLVVGTHALLSGEIRFADLGLVIVDEQHRFGVAQRLRLGTRGSKRRPHLLVMTATPIPRSLALVLYAGLELTTIEAKPPGRVPPTTKMVSTNAAHRRCSARSSGRSKRRAGRSSYVQRSPRRMSSSACRPQSSDEMKARFGADRVGQIHGRLSGEERREVDACVPGGRRLQVLVGTTVLEVGVDIPAANIMVIEQAERFGLAQLHQLRGTGRPGGTAKRLPAHV